MCSLGSALDLRWAGVRITSCHRPGCWYDSFICNRETREESATNRINQQSSIRFGQVTGSKATPPHIPVVSCRADELPAAGDSSRPSTTYCTRPSPCSTAAKWTRPDRGVQTLPCTFWRVPGCCRQHSWRERGREWGCATMGLDKWATNDGHVQRGQFYGHFKGRQLLGLMVARINGFITCNCQSPPTAHS